MKHTKRWLVLCLVMVMLFSVSSLIAGKKDKTPEPEPAPAAEPEKTKKTTKEGGDIVYGTWQSPENLDAQVSGLQITLAIGTQIHDPLLRQKPGDSKIYPGVAERYEVNDDSTEYTCKFKEGCKVP